MVKKSFHPKSYDSIPFNVFAMGQGAGITFEINSLVAIIIAIVGLGGGVIFFMWEINKSSELKERITRPATYLVGLLLIFSTSLLGGILFPSIIAVVFLFISLGGVRFFVWAINKEIRKNQEIVVEKEVS